LCLWSGFIYPRIRTFDKKTFSLSLFQKEAFEIDSWIQNHEMKLRSTFSAEENFANETTWIAGKTKQDSEIWPFLSSLLEK